MQKELLRDLEQRDITKLSKNFTLYLPQLIASVKVKLKSSRLYLECSAIEQEETILTIINSARMLPTVHGL